MKNKQNANKSSLILATGKSRITKWHFIVLPWMICIVILLNCSCVRTFQEAGTSQQQAVADDTHNMILAGSDSVKWHPGHYYTLMGWGKSSPSYMNKVYAELDSTTALRGMQVRFTWRELEPLKDQYNFALIDSELAQLSRITQVAAKKKRLIILLQIKSFTTNTNDLPVPDYVRATGAPYYAGAYAYAPSDTSAAASGYMVKLWVTSVFNRLATLVQKLGQRYNSNSYFEGIGITETSPGKPFPAGSVSDANLDAFWPKLEDLNQELRDAFPNTVTYQFANYPRNVLTTLIPALAGMGAGLGCPDIFLTDPGLRTTGGTKGVYDYFPLYSGKIPLAPSVQNEDYRNTQHDGMGYQPTLTQLLNFGKDSLMANYLFWTRDPVYYNDVLTLLNNLYPNSPTGALKTGCPLSFSGKCKTN
ncbi:hypothetical protein [Niabella aurantiaca]|uniref:hypothetical protein n=1 Tax=Niabella aurantiaca TaxID=379900 RepID=UPI000684C6BE|nr:hypothetical protein [Niabella aurantiaca]